MGRDKENYGTLSVSGIGEVKTRPDIAIVRLAAVTEAKTATEAVEQNAQRVTQILNQLRALQVPQKDIETTGIEVIPITRYDEQTGRVIREGYRAINALAIRVPIESAGQVFDAGIAAGADESSGITFGLRNDKSYRVEALQAAVSAAESEAAVVARTSGVRLLGARSINVEHNGGPIDTPLKLARAEAAGTPVFPGELTIAARVQVTYAFEQR